MSQAVSFASFLSMAAAMALGNEMEKKRKAAQMSAAALSFFLDREGHKKFLRATTNQELEAENTALKAEVEELKEAVDYYNNEMGRAVREANSSHNRCAELVRELTIVKRDRDKYKNDTIEYQNLMFQARTEEQKLEERIQQAISKALHPDWPDTEDQEDEEEEEDNSPSPSFVD